MNSVYRYDPVITTGAFPEDGDYADMEHNEFGSWVTLDDYQKLETQVSLLKKFMKEALDSADKIVDVLDYTLYGGVLKL